MTTSITVSDRIHYLLKDRGMSVAGLIEASGIADKTMRRRLKRPDTFMIGELIIVADVLEVQLEFLVSGTLPVELRQAA